MTKTLTERVEALEKAPEAPSQDLKKLSGKVAILLQNVNHLNELYEITTKPYRCDCGKLMVYYPIGKNFRCAECNKEMALYGH